MPDPRNWSGGGHRSVDQMFINLMRGVFLTDDEFAEELTRRREALDLAEGARVIGCPLCGIEGWMADAAAEQQQ